MAYGLPHMGLIILDQACNNIILNQACNNIVRDQACNNIILDQACNNIFTNNLPLGSLSKQFQHKAYVSGLHLNC